METRMAMMNVSWQETLVPGSGTERKRGGEGDNGIYGSENEGKMRGRRVKSGRLQGLTRGSRNSKRVLTCTLPRYTTLGIR